MHTFDTVSCEQRGDPEIMLRPREDIKTGISSRPTARIWDAAINSVSKSCKRASHGIFAEVAPFNMIAAIKQRRNMGLRPET